MQLIPATLRPPFSLCSSSVCCLTSIPNTAAGAFPQGFSLGEKLKKKKKVATAFPAPSAEENQPGGNEEGRGRGTLSTEPPGEQHRAAGGGAGGAPTRDAAAAGRRCRTRGCGFRRSPGAAGPAPGPPPCAAPWDGADVRRRRGNLRRKPWSGGQGAHSARRARHPAAPGKCSGTAPRASPRSRPPHARLPASRTVGPALPSLLPSCATSRVPLPTPRASLGSRPGPVFPSPEVRSVAGPRGSDRQTKRGRAGSREGGGGLRPSPLRVAARPAALRPAHGRGPWHRSSA